MGILLFVCGVIGYGVLWMIIGKIIGVLEPTEFAAKAVGVTFFAFCLLFFLFVVYNVIF